MPNLTDEQRRLNYLELDSRTSKTIMDSVDGNYYREESVRQCPHPGIIKKYGQISGVVNIHFTRCRKCKYAITFRYHGGVKCGYKKEK